MPLLSAYTFEKMLKQSGISEERRAYAESQLAFIHRMEQQQNKYMHDMLKNYKNTLPFIPNENIHIF